MSDKAMVVNAVATIAAAVPRKLRYDSLRREQPPDSGRLKIGPMKEFECPHSESEWL